MEEGELTGSMFEAAEDARLGRIWERCSRHYTLAGERSVGVEGAKRTGCDRYRSTQERQLGLCTQLLAVSRDQPEALSEELAELLGVERMLLQEQRKRLETNSGLRVRGEVVCTVLRSMPRGMRYERLLACGRAVGLWGEALHWDPELCVSRRLPFRISGTRAPPGS